MNKEKRQAALLRKSLRRLLLAHWKCVQRIIAKFPTAERRRNAAVDEDLKAWEIEK